MRKKFCFSNSLILCFLLFPLRKDMKALRKYSLDLLTPGVLRKKNSTPLIFKIFPRDWKSEKSYFENKGYSLIQKSIGNGFQSTNPSEVLSLSSIFGQTSAKEPSWSPRATSNEAKVENCIPFRSYLRIE